MATTVKKFDAEQHDQLSDVEYRVIRKTATEHPFAGKYWNHWRRSVYNCVCCGMPLFESLIKFNAGCDWPNCFQLISDKVINEKIDRSHDILRTEAQRKNCGMHFSHVLEDGSALIRPRYCINSAALNFGD